MEECIQNELLSLSKFGVEAEHGVRRKIQQEEGTR